LSSHHGACIGTGAFGILHNHLNDQRHETWDDWKGTVRRHKQRKTRNYYSGGNVVTVEKSKEKKSKVEKLECEQEHSTEERGDGLHVKRGQNFKPLATATKKGEKERQRLRGKSHFCI